MKKQLIVITILLAGMLISQSLYAKNHLNCYGYLTEMVRNSNFPLREVGKNKINLLIDDDQPNMITAQVGYDIIQQPDNSSFVSIGWIRYDVMNHILWNNSADLDEYPVKLLFNQKYSVGFDQCLKR